MLITHNGTGLKFKEIIPTLRDKYGDSTNPLFMKKMLF